MKVFISVDLEGAAGYIGSAEGISAGEIMAAEANAAIAGAFDGGAEEVIVVEAHGSKRNINPQRIDPRARILSGRPRTPEHMGGIDETFGAAIFIAYHARAGTLRGVISHTYTGVVFSLRINDIEVGETGADAAIAGHFGVPVVMVSGDDAVCREAKELLGDIETVVVKKGVSRSAAVCIPPPKAYEMIRQGAARALEKVGSIQAFVIEPPIHVEVTFTDPSYADTICFLPFVNRVDGRTVAYDAPNLIYAMKIFDGFRFLSTAIR
ncbi:MAG: M55 family metallopeptidase [Candidatus Poribacteria bacterium]